MLSDLCHWKQSLWIYLTAVSHSQCLEMPQVMLPCRHELVSSSSFIPFCGRGLVHSHCWVQAWLGSSGSWGQLLSSCNTWTHSAGTCAAPSPSGHAWPGGTQQVTNPGTQQVTNPGPYSKLQILGHTAGHKPWDTGNLEAKNQTLPVSGTVPKGCPGPCRDWGTLPSVPHQSWLDSDILLLSHSHLPVYWRRHQPFLPPAFPQAPGKPHAPKIDAGPGDDAVQSQEMSALPIHTLGWPWGGPSPGWGSPQVGEEGCSVPQFHPLHPRIHHLQSFLVLHSSRGSEGILGYTLLFLHLSVHLFNPLLRSTKICHISTLFFIKCEGKQTWRQCVSSFATHMETGNKLDWGRRY